MRSLLLASACLLSTPAWAEEITAEEGGAGDEVVVIAPDYVPEGSVTATKTNAPLIEVPQSVSVVTRDQIDLLNFIDVQQAVRYTSGIVGENYGPDLRFDFLTIRGFTPVQYIDGLQAPVSATIANVGVDLYGFESVDVLKGPASVLYGSSPPGGIYNLTSRRPESPFGGEVQAKLGTQGFKQIAGTITGALTDGVSARLTGLFRDRGSQTDFVDQTRVYAAPAVAVEIGPDTRLTALGFYQHDRVEGDTNGFLPASGTVTRNPLGRVPRSVNLGEPDINFYERDQWSAGYELAHDFGPARLVQNLRWSDYREEQRVIYGGGGLAADNRTVFRFDFPFRDDVRQFAADTRLDGEVTTGPVTHRLVGGVDYRNYRERSAFGFGFATPIDLFDPVYGAYDAPAPALVPFTNQRLKQTGLYLQDQARVGDLILTASGRQDWVETTQRATGDKVDQDKFTYRLGATYLTKAGLAPYLSYATSFQPTVGQDLGGRAFRPTTGRQIEAGVKLDDRALGGGVSLFATAAVYRLEQDNVLTPDPANSLFQVQTGEVTVEGAELELVTRLADRTSVNAAYTYADARVTRSNVAGQLGAGLPFQPEHKASLFVDHTFAGPLAGFGLGAGVRYLSDSPGGLPDAFNPVVIRTGGSTLFDAVVRYDFGDWRFAVNAANLFDERYVARCTGPAGCFFGPARQVIATVTKGF